MVDRRTPDELEGLLAGRDAGRRGPLGAWLADLRRAADTPPPAPRGELAQLLADGLSTEKGDLPATAGSNVTGPARQAAGLPKWRQDKMIGTGGLFSGLAGKLAGLGVPAKALMALGLVATTVTGAGAATGSLPDPAQRAVSGVVNAVSPIHIPTGDDGGRAVAGVKLGKVPGVGADVDASVGAGGASVDAGASSGNGRGHGNGGTSGSASVGGVTPTLPSVPGLPGLPGLPGVPEVPGVPGLPGLPTIPGLPGVGDLPVGVPDCATSIVDPATGSLLVAPSQLSGKVLDCVKSMVPAGTIPASVTECLTSVLNSLQGVLGGGVPTGVPSVDIADCAPLDVSPCVGSVMGAVGANPLAVVSNLGSLTNAANLLNVGDLAGCVPVSATECVSSILGAFSAGNVTNIDLSACLPTSVNGLG